jgi:hypothetical protein
MVVQPMCEGDQTYLFLKSCLGELVCFSIEFQGCMREVDLLEVVKERIDSVHPSQEGDRMKLTTIIEPVYYNFGVVDQM